METQTQNQTQYLKVLTFKDLLWSGLSSMIGVGIFVILTDVTRYSKNYAWISMLLAGISVLFTTFSYAELASIYNSNTTEYSYIKEVTNDKFALLSYFFISISDLLVLATIALGFGNYVGSIINQSSILIAVVSLIFFNIINFLGIKTSVAFSQKALMIKLFALGLIIFMGLFRCNSLNLVEPQVQVTPIINGSMYALFAYIGFQYIINLSEESIHPETDIPKAMLYGVGITTIIYTLVTIVSLMCIGSNALSLSNVPLANVCSELFGQHGSMFLKVLAIVALADTLLMSSVSQSRSFHGIFEKIIPNFTQTDLHQKYKTPHISIIILTVLTILLVCCLQSVSQTAIYGDIIALVTFLGVNIIAIIMRYKSPDVKRGFTIPFNIGKMPIISVCGALTSLYALYVYSTNL